MLTVQRPTRASNRASAFALGALGVLCVASWIGVFAYHLAPYVAEMPDLSVTTVAAPDGDTQ